MGLADSFYLLCFDDRHRDVTICVMKFHLRNGSDYQTFFQAGSGNLVIYLFMYVLIWEWCCGSVYHRSYGWRGFKCIEQGKGEMCLNICYCPHRYTNQEVTLLFFGTELKFSVYIKPHTFITSWFKNWRMNVEWAQN